MTVGVGIIGLGFMGRTHLGAYLAADGVAVRALHDPAKRASATSTPARGNLITAGGSVDEALSTLPHEASVDLLLARTDIDLVSICTPTDSHIGLVRAAIAARKHVLVEKPTALDADAIDALAAEAERVGVLVMPAHCMRFWPAWTWMAEAIRKERFGRVLEARFRRVGARPAWSQDFYLDVHRSGGALVDLHIHDADFIRFAFGEPEGVEARGTRMHVEARYRFAGGLVVEAEGGWMDDPNFAFAMEARIACERGTMDFAIGRDPELVVHEPGGATQGRQPRTIVAGTDYPAGTGYDHEIRAMVEAVRSRAKAAPVTLADAARTQRLLDAEARSLGVGSQG